MIANHGIDGLDQWHPTNTINREYLSGMASLVLIFLAWRCSFFNGEHCKLLLFLQAPNEVTFHVLLIELKLAW